MAKLTWLITGCSSGFGEQMVQAALNRHDQVIATARGDLKRLQHLRDLGATILELDVSAPPTTLDAKIKEALAVYGDIDVLVNNAGYIEAGLLEDVSPERMQANMATNLFGAINLTRSLMPTLRAKQSGTVVWVGSCGGWQGEIGAGQYCASKFAMEGVVECWQKESAFFNIKQVLFEPGNFTTKVYSPSNIKFEPPRVSALSELHNAVQQGVAAVDGNQPGDPAKAAERMVDVVRQEGMAAGREIPLRLPLGRDSMAQIKNKCELVLKTIGEWEDFIVSTDREGATDTRIYENSMESKKVAS